MVQHCDVPLAYDLRGHGVRQSGACFMAIGRRLRMEPFINDLESWAMESSKDETLCKIATDALRAIQRGTTVARHQDLWELAISRVNKAKRDIEADEDLARSRDPVNQAPRTGIDF